MQPALLDKLRMSEGKVVRLTSTEGEVMTAKVLSVSDESQDVVVDVLSTDQPERYERFGKKHSEGAWAIPFDYISEVEAPGLSGTGQ
jgi:hypothetical protein